MNNIEPFIESGPYGTLIVRSIDHDEKILDFQLELLTRHRPEWLVPGHLRFRNGSAQICFNTTGLVPLESWHADSQRYSETGLQILQLIIRQILQAADHLVDIDQIVCSPNMIFKQNTADQIIKLIFWPIGTRPNQTTTFSALISQIAAAYQIDSVAADMLITSYIDSGVEGLAECLISLLKSNGEMSEATETKFSGFSQSILEQIKSFYERIRGYADNWLRQKVPADERTDSQTVLIVAEPSDFRMALLSSGKPGTPEENEGLRAYILIDEFLVGRDNKNCDLCLESPGIGRMHARIVRRAGSFFITDLGSRNGTRIDGCRLTKNVEHLIPENCLIEFADQSFFFQAD